MVSLTQVLVASALVAFGSAAPTPEKRGVAPFTINMVAKANTSVKNGPSAYLKALKKFNASSEKIAVVADSSSVTATPDQYDSEYTCPVTIGDQQFTMDFDTGSSDLWVLGSSLESAGYSPSSSASRETGETWSISYGDGSSASGIIYSDTVTIGETTVTGQGVEVAQKASSEFTSGDNDGLVGLAFDSINTATPNQVSTFFTNAINQGLDAVFAADLKYEAAGSYTFGSIPSDLYTGDITYTDVDDSEGFWMFTPDGYAIGDGDEVTPGSSAMTGIADTGTTLMLVDSSVASAYWAQVSSASSSSGSYSFDCNDASSLPDFVLYINGYAATVPGEYINYAPNGDGTCYGGIQTDEGVGFAIYGDIFLKSQLVVFDRTQDTPQIGFAAQS